MVALMALVAAGTPGVAHAATVRVSCSSVALQLEMRFVPDGGTLSLAKHCIYSYAAPDNTANALPLIDRALTIEGHGSTIMRSASAASGFRLFEVGVNGKLTLNHVVIKGGDTRAAGGAGGGLLVDVGGSLNLDSSKVTNNVGGGSGGGGIEVDGTLAMTRSVVSGNANPGFGGGVDVELGATAHIARSTIAGNVANVGGGAWNAGTFTLDKTTLSGNVASVCGGVCLTAGIQTITRSRIIGNTAMGSAALGGGIHTAGGTITITTTKISRNLATGASAAGGGIYVSGAAVTLTRDKITKNVATGTMPRGGGVFRASGTVTLHRTSIKKNSPDQCGTPTTVPGC